MNNTFNVVVGPRGKMPTRGTEDAAGWDLYSAEDVTIAVGGHRMVDTDIKMEIPVGHFGFLVPRSGMACKHGLIFRSSNVVDADYRGNVGLSCFNLSDKPLVIKQGDRIGQIVIIPYAHYMPIGATVLSETVRGEGGFGSTGK